MAFANQVNPARKQTGTTKKTTRAALLGADSWAEALKAAGITAKPGGGYVLPDVTTTTTNRTSDQQPFLNPDQSNQQIDTEDQYKQALWQMDTDYQNQSVQNEYDKSQIDKGATYGKRDTNDAMAGRGLSQSSIKDAEIFDIDATARARKQLMDNQLANMAVQNATRKEQLNTAFNDHQRAFNDMKVGNAAAVNATPAKTTTTAAPAFSTVHLKDSKGKLRTWHIYPDGRRQMVA